MADSRERKPVPRGDIQRLLDAEEEAESVVEAARAEAERLRAEARDDARRIARRAGERVSLMHRRTSEAIERERAELEEDGARRRDAVEEHTVPEGVRQRVVAAVAAELTAGDGDASAGGQQGGNGVGGA
jgi:cell division septum initiation protein DivIVA